MNITNLLYAGYDDIVTFGRAMFETQWQYSDNPGDHIFDYFEAPHKWEREHQKWKELGGTLDDECLRAFEDWYDHKDDPEDEDE